MPRDATSDHADHDIGPAVVDQVVTLAGDARVHIRAIRASDKGRFALAFTALSWNTRYRRCFHGKKTLTHDELAFYTEVDGNEHFALIALSAAGGSAAGEVVADARFVRASDDNRIAELAIVVADAWQRRGLGQLLLEQLVGAAAERGVETLRCEVLAENGPMRKLITRVYAGATLKRDGAVAVVDLPVPPNATPQERESAAAERAIAQAIMVPFALTTLSVNLWWEGMRRASTPWLGRRSRILPSPAAGDPPQQG